MSDKSKIEWTDATWGPVTGCTKVSNGCKFCYALREWPRLSAPRPKPNIYTGRQFTDVQCHPQRLDQPLRWRKPRRVFVNSMSDLFHRDVPFEFIIEVFAIMALCPQHTFQILTKRPDRMLNFLTSKNFDQAGLIINKMHQSMIRAGKVSLKFKWPIPNVWFGVSVEDQATADERIPLLLQTPAAVRFISAEPLLGNISTRNINLPDGGRLDALKGVDTAYQMNYVGKLDWVIVGGESGPNARPFNIGWGLSIVEQCSAAGVPCFVKQLGGHVIQGGERRIKKSKKGADMSEWPHELRVREYPEPEKGE